MSTTYTQGQDVKVAYMGDAQYAAGEITYDAFILSADPTDPNMTFCAVVVALESVPALGIRKGDTGLATFDGFLRANRIGVYA